MRFVDLWDTKPKQAQVQRQVKKALPYTIEYIGGPAEYRLHQKKVLAEEAAWQKEKAIRNANARERAISMFMVDSRRLDKSGRIIELPKLTPPKPWHKRMSEAVGNWLLKKLNDAFSQN